jgi:MFS family permease
LGAFIGALIAGPLSDKIGRKPTIIISDILFTFGAANMAFSWSILSLMVGRIIVGLGIGIASMVVPIYISEICPKELRG